VSPSLWLVDKLLSSLLVELKHTSGSHHPLYVSLSLTPCQQKLYVEKIPSSISRRWTSSRNSILWFIFIGVFFLTVKRYFFGLSWNHGVLGSYWKSCISDLQIRIIVNATGANIYRSEKPNFENSSQNESTPFASFCEFGMNTVILSLCGTQYCFITVWNSRIWIFYIGSNILRHSVFRPNTTVYLTF
jgi:hypothetical protein